MITTEQLGQALENANALLEETASLWEPAPFKQPVLPWEADHPELAAGLRAIDEHTLDEVERSPAHARRLLARWLPRFADRAARLEPGQLRGVGHADVNPALAEGMPARKWEQIQAFASCAPGQPYPILEWCSGKGHLTRLLSELRAQPGHCIELDERLAHAGRQIAEERDLPVAFSVLDALGDEAASAVKRDQLACALHACGALHLRLIREAAAQQTRALAVSPCCYHLVAEETYQPQSEMLQSLTRLALTREQLRLSLQETVTAAPAVRRRRERLAAWRLGFDLLQRQLRGVNEYLPVPSAKPAMAAGTFEDFARWAARKKQIDLPARVDWDQYEYAGDQRFSETRRLSVVRHLFRRPIEVWLVLDRAQFLVESGYTVEVGTFCERRITPRNLMIRAWRA
ncbi:MAG: methyltransferase [Pseudomonadota bacterium]